MIDLMVVLILASFVGLIIGLIKPSLLKLKSRKQALYVLGGSIVSLFILTAIFTGPTPAPTPNGQASQVKTPEKQAALQPAPKPKTLEEKVTDAINASLGSKTNMDKPRVVSVEVDKYDTKMLSAYKYKSGESVVSLLIKINASENITTNLQKSTMHNEATKIAQAIFPIDQTVGDVIIWSQLPVKDKYGNIKDDTAIVYSMSRSLFDKINWSTFNYRDLPTLLTSENSVDDRNNYFEKITF